MKAIIKSITAFAILITCSTYCLAQTDGINALRLNLGRIEPYQMEITYNKTSHIIFPAAIRQVDLGSEYLIGDTAASNVLRIKASVRDFNEETNFSVITEDGRFYSFDVHYSPYPHTLSYDLLKMRRFQDRSDGGDVLFQELGSTSPSLAGLLMETIYKKDKMVIKHIGSRSYGIQFLLKGIYVQDGKFYFHTELRNKSNVPFLIDFITFKVVDKKVVKRTLIQEKPVPPLRIYKPLDKVSCNTAEQNVYLLDQFTIADDKALLIEIFEKNGGRHQVIRVQNSDLVHAKLISNMHLKTN